MVSGRTASSRRRRGESPSLSTSSGSSCSPELYSLSQSLVSPPPTAFADFPARWLLYKGKADKAERALVKIHKDSDDYELLIQEQLAILNKSREEEAESSSGQSKWSDLWTNPVERRKLFCTVGILVSQQISGVQFIFSYTTTFFTLVGLDDTFVITIVSLDHLFRLRIGSSV